MFIKINDKALAGLTLCVCGLFASAAPAAISTGFGYEASAEIEVTMLGVSNLTSPGSLDDLYVISSVLTGQDSAGANAVNVSSLMAHDPLAVGQSVSLSAHTSALGQADSLLDLSGLIDLLNDSTTDTYEVELSIGYKLAASVSVDDDSIQSVVADSYLEIFDDLGEIDVFEVVSAESGWFSDDPVDDGLTLTLTIAPLDSNTLSLNVAAIGSAVTTVPLPASVWMFMAASGLLAWRARRR
ncbi:MAG: hypothetical protein KDK91_09410 [Gammaproteobacteria bacterium]|nr:hypothetical protein [Gammaproteobacteria bacterium]